MPQFFTNPFCKGNLTYHENVLLFSVLVSPLCPQHQPTPARGVSHTNGCCGTVQQMLSKETTEAKALRGQ